MLTWITPEIIMLLSSTTTFIICSRMVKEESPDIPDQNNQYNKPSLIFVISKMHYRQACHRFNFFSCVAAKYLVYIYICFTAITEPCLPNALLIFLLMVCAIYWAKYSPISLTKTLCCVMVITTCSLLALNAYQFDYVQDKIGGDKAFVSR